VAWEWRKWCEGYVWKWNSRPQGERLRYKSRDKEAWGIGHPRRLDVAARRHQLRLTLMANQDSAHTGAIARYGNKCRYGTVSQNGSDVREGRQPILLARGHREPCPRHARPRPSGQGLSVVHGPQAERLTAFGRRVEDQALRHGCCRPSSTHHVRHRDPSGLSSPAGWRGRG
jgi:hypothetical protein